MPPTITHYIVRPGSTTLLPSGGRAGSPGRLVPLVAVDQLPPWLEIVGVPRQLTPAQAVTMIAVGGYDEEAAAVAGRSDGREKTKNDKDDKDDKGRVVSWDVISMVRNPLDVRVSPGADVAGGTGTNTSFPIVLHAKDKKDSAAPGLAGTGTGGPASAPTSTSADASAASTSISHSTTPPASICPPSPQKAVPAEDNAAILASLRFDGAGKGNETNVAAAYTAPSDKDVLPDEGKDVDTSSSSSFDALDAYARVLASHSTPVTAAAAATAAVSSLRRATGPATKDTKAPNGEKEASKGRQAKHNENVPEEPKAKAAANLRGFGNDSDEEGDLFLVNPSDVGVNTWGWKPLPKPVEKRESEVELPIAVDWGCWPKEYANGGSGGYGGRTIPGNSWPGPAAPGRVTPPRNSARPAASPQTASLASAGSSQPNRKAKTRICRFWLASGHCWNGEKCQFAHPTTRQDFELLHVARLPLWWIKKHPSQGGASGTSSVEGESTKGKKESKDKGKGKAGTSPPTKSPTATAATSPAAPAAAPRRAMLLMPLPPSAAEPGPTRPPAPAPAGTSQTPRVPVAGDKKTRLGPNEVTDLVEL